MTRNTQSIVSIVVSALEARNYPDFSNFFLTKKSINSLLERAKTVFESPYSNVNFPSDQLK